MSHVSICSCFFISEEYAKIIIVNFSSKIYAQREVWKFSFKSLIPIVLISVVVCFFMCFYFSCYFVCPSMCIFTETHPDSEYFDVTLQGYKQG